MIPTSYNYDAGEKFCWDGDNMDYMDNMVNMEQVLKRVSRQPKDKWCLLTPLKPNIIHENRCIIMYFLIHLTPSDLPERGNQIKPKGTGANVVFMFLKKESAL